MFEVLPVANQLLLDFRMVRVTDAKTLEKSVDGDIRKLSLLLDHEMRCCILGSSSILGDR